MGEYVILDKSAPVAVSTLASVALVDTLAQGTPHGLAIVGKTETENIGVNRTNERKVSQGLINAIKSMAA